MNLHSCRKTSRRIRIEKIHSRAKELMLGIKPAPTFKEMKAAVLGVQ